MQRPELDVETLLKQDASGFHKQNILAELSEESGKIRSALNKGVGPDEYKQLESLLHATDSAATVVEKIWQHFASTRTCSLTIV